MTENNKLFNLIESYNNTNEQLEIIYFTCCILGGYESIDYLLHNIVHNISITMNVDLSLYYPCKVNIIDRMNETIKYYDFYNNDQKKIINKFIENIKKREQIKNTTKYNEYIKELMSNTTTLRGFNQSINFNKLYMGNFYCVKNYFINNIDIDIMNKLIKINKGEDMIKIFKLYLQVPQLMHPNNNYAINRICLKIENNFCIDNKIYKDKSDCIKFDATQANNLMVILINFGDCRELALLLEFYYVVKEWNKYMKYMKNYNKNKTKIIKLIRSMKRITNVDIYFSGYNNNNDKYDYSITDFIPITNQKYDIMYKNIKYIFYENHNFVIKFKYNNNKLKLYAADLMYNKYDKKFINTKFIGDYLIDGKKLNFDNKIIKPNYTNYEGLPIDIGSNDYNKDINVIGIVKKTLFNNFEYRKDHINKFLFLSKPLTLPKNFYNINEFIVAREKKFNFLREKYLRNKNKVYHYDGKDNHLKYFLLEDL
jgi:hypothetical protein